MIQDAMGMREPRFRVLVIEDNDDSRELMVALLRAWDFHAVGARDGLEALAIADEMPFDLVLSDQAMPRMTGAEVAQRFAKRRDLARTPFVFVTGMPTPSLPNVIGRMTKPIDVEQLETLLEGLRAAKTRPRGRVATGQRG